MDESGRAILPAAIETAGDQLVAGLSRLGMETIYISPGSEWPPLWEAISKAGPAGPRLVNTRHELLAVSAAIGHWRRNGDLTCVALHTTVGMLNAAMGLRMALHEQVPMVVLTGESVTFGERPGMRIEPQWLRALTDLGGPAQLASAFCKWSCRLEDTSLLAASLRHAAEVALAPPRGPVVLSLPVETLLQPAGPDGLPAGPPVQPRYEVPAAAIDELAARLLDARQPVIVTEHAGRRPETVALLVALAELLGAPVIQSQAPAYMNFPRSHPLHLGYEVGPHTADTDLWLLAGCATPAHPPSLLRGRAVVALAEEPEGALSPIGRQGADTVLLGPLDQSLERLLSAIRTGAADRPGWSEAALARRLRWSVAHDQMLAQWDREAGDDPEEAIFIALRRLLPAAAVILEETTIHRQSMLRQLNRDLPGTFYSRLTGGLGVMLGEALGIKLAAPDELVGVVLGDGALHYSPALAALGMAQEYDLPLLVCVINNAGYASMRRTHRVRFPQGYAASHDAFCGVGIEPDPDYAGLAACYGGYGVRVQTVAELEAALPGCVERVRRGQTCIVDIVCGR